MLTQLAKTSCETRESRLDNNEHLVVTAQLQAFSSVANAPKYAVPMLGLKSANYDFLLEVSPYTLLNGGVRYITASLWQSSLLRVHTAFASDVFTDFDFSSKGVPARIQNSTNTRNKKRQHSPVCPLTLSPVLALFRILVIMNQPGRRNRHPNSVPATSAVNQQTTTK